MPVSPVLAVLLLAVAWGTGGSAWLEARILSAVGNRPAPVRSALVFALGTGGAGLALMAVASWLLDHVFLLGWVLLGLLSAATFAVMPLVLLCMPLQVSLWKYLREDLERVGLSRRAARAWIAVMAPWALLMMMLHVLATLVLVYTWE